MMLRSVNLSNETAIDEVKRFLTAGWYGAAHLRLEEILETYPENIEAQAYLAWANFNLRKSNLELRDEAIDSVVKAVALRRDDHDLAHVLGMLLRTAQRYSEAEQCFRKAYNLDPSNREALRQLELMRLRQEPAGGDWPEVKLEEVDVRAPITLQTRIHSYFRVSSLQKREVRIGCAEKDDIQIGETVVPEIVKNHCTILIRGGRHFARRNGSRGGVWIDGKELPIRREVRLRSGQTLRLGGQGRKPAFEARIVTIHNLHQDHAQLAWQAAQYGQAG